MTKGNRKRCFLAGYGILWQIIYPEFGKEPTSTYPIKKQHLLHFLSVKIGIYVNHFLIKAEIFALF
jgi:hypothetical protein